MKFSIVVSTQPAAFSAVAFKEHLAESIEKVAHLGYDGVELAVRDPSLLDVPKVQALVKSYDLVVPAIGTGQAFGEEGLSLTHPDPSIRRKAIDRIKSHLELAERLGALVIIGLIRGRIGTQKEVDRVWDWLVQGLRECALTGRGSKLAIEPINRYETDLVNTVDAGLRLIEWVDCPNVGLLLDSFHMNIEETSIAECIGRCRERLLHFHVADSNRWHPGAGHIDFSDIVTSLQNVGYTGFLSAEIMPLPDADEAARNTIECLRAVASQVKWRSKTHAGSGPAVSKSRQSDVERAQSSL